LPNQTFPTIGDRLSEIYRRSDADGISTVAVADEMVAERLRNAIAGNPVALGDGAGEVAVTVSIGIAMTREGGDSDGQRWAGSVDVGAAARSRRGAVAGKARL